MEVVDIPIDWEFSKVGTSAKFWYHWSLGDFCSPLFLLGHRLEERLGWPKGTYGVLVAAFQKRLSRSIGWEASSDNSFVNAVEVAARVYKRGVGFRIQSQSSSLQVESQRGRYLVRVHSGFPTPEASIGKDEFVLVDRKVFTSWPQIFSSANVIKMELSEQEKNLDAVAEIIEAWVANGRASQWVVFGGGLLCDVAAFSAALVGCSIRFVPTTLLAMADACVGGKTGVNFLEFGKNQVGAFYFPSHVDVWPGWLTSLSYRHMRAGIAECIKHFFLSADKQKLHCFVTAALAKDMEQLRICLPAIIRVKADIVADDPMETGKRAILNFGHTLAHALESLSQSRTQGEQTILHGEAVAIGLKYALLLSKVQNFLSEDIYQDMLTVLLSAAIDFSESELSRWLGVDSQQLPECFDLLWDFMMQDKKNGQEEESTQFILLTDWGSVARGPKGEWTIPISRDVAAAAWKSLLRHKTIK